MYLSNVCIIFYIIFLILLLITIFKDLIKNINYKEYRAVLY